MHLRRQVLRYVSIVMIALCFVLLAVGAFSILSSAERTDRVRAVSDSERLDHALASREADYARQAKDWSMWDATYNYLQTRDPAYIAENLPDSTMANLKLNVFALFDARGQPVYVKCFDLDSGKPTTIASIGRLLADTPSLNLAAASISKGGIVTVAGGRSMILGAATVLPSSAKGKGLGTLVMGRLLDPALVSEIARETQLSVEIDQSSAEAGPVSARTSGDYVLVSSPLEDVTGRQFGRTVVKSAREAWKEAGTSTIFFAIGLVILVGSTVPALGHGMDAIVLRRLGLLSDGVGRTTSSGVPERLEIGGSDELSSLASDVEGMARALDYSRGQVEEARQQLELRVEERTAELRRAVTELEDEVALRRAAEDAAAASTQRYRSLIENLADVVFVADREGILRFISPAVEATLGFSPEELVGKAVTALLGKSSREPVLQRIKKGIPETGEHVTSTAMTRDGRELDAEIILTPLLGMPGEVQGILRDITAQKQHENQLIHMASHDFLTGLPNRRRFEDEVRRALVGAQRRSSHGAVLWFDLDRFKEVNDLLGHKAGDELLVGVARRLSSVVRGDSVLARLGGDEFAVLLPGADETEAKGAAERLLKEVAQVSMRVDGRVARASASLGIVLYPESGDDTQELLARADMAMYQAKELGGAHYRLYEAGDDWRSAIEDRRTWVEQIELALTQDGLVLYAQPIADATTGTTVGYELLVRMLGLDGEPILPERFLPVAERVGLIVDIDIWVLREAIGLLAQTDGEGFGLNVNVSARTLGDDRWLDVLTSEISASNADSARLTIEITETAIINDIARADDVVRAIKRLGCRVSLDDFGSGFTSFQHLKQLDLDDIKIDGSFVQGLINNLDDQHLVKAIVEMASGLRLRTTAEYVESEESLQMLRSFGVQQVQGYALGRPGPNCEVLPQRSGQLSA